MVQHRAFGHNTWDLRWTYWGFHKWGYPNSWMIYYVFFWVDLGVPPFQGTTISAVVYMGWKQQKQLGIPPGSDVPRREPLHQSDETGSDRVRVISDPPKTEITSKTGGWCCQWTAGDFWVFLFHILFVRILLRPYQWHPDIFWCWKPPAPPWCHGSYSGQPALWHTVDM